MAEVAKDFSDIPFLKKSNGQLPASAYTDLTPPSPEFASAWQLATRFSSLPDNEVGGFYFDESPRPEFAAVFGDGSVDINTGYTTISGGLSPYQNAAPGSSIGRRLPGSLEYILGNYMPKTLCGKIRRAFEWAKSDDLLKDLLEILKDFTSAGFQLRCKPEEGGVFEALVSTGKPLKIPSEAPVEFELSPEELKGFHEQAQFQRTLNRVERKWEFYSLVTQLIEDWIVCDSMILFWRVAVKNTVGESDSSVPTILPDSSPSGRQELIPGLLQICALNPGLVDYSDSLGQDKLQVYIPQELIKIIKEICTKNPGGTPERAKALADLVASGVHQKYIDAVLANKDKVEMRNADGEYWLIKTKGRKYHGLACPSMTTIFLPLESRKVLGEGDFTAHYMMKHFIFHVTIGESIQAGPLAGQKINWATKKQIQEFMLKMQQPVKTYRMVTDHTFKFTYVFPPKEMFDTEKYKKPEERIMNWIGITQSVLSGQGATYGGGFIGIKKLQANIVASRRHAGWLVTEFFDHDTVRDLVKVPEGSVVSGVFDENVLKEPKQLLDEIKLMLSQGFGDPRIATQELGREPDSMRRSKMESLVDNQQTGVYRPVYVQSFGGGQPFNQGGRPAGDNTTQNPDTRQQAPASGGN